MLETEQEQLSRRGFALYEQYGKPLEADHTGEYVAIAENGHFVLAPTLRQAAVDGAACLGRGHFVFKVGERVVGTWRTPHIVGASKRPEMR